MREKEIVYFTCCTCCWVQTYCGLSGFFIGCRFAVSAGAEPDDKRLLILQLRDASLCSKGPILFIALCANPSTVEFE